MCRWFWSRSRWTSYSWARCTARWLGALLCWICRGFSARRSNKTPHGQRRTSYSSNHSLLWHAWLLSRCPSRLHLTLPVLLTCGWDTMTMAPNARAACAKLMCFTWLWICTLLRFSESHQTRALICSLQPINHLLDRLLNLVMCW